MAHLSVSQLCAMSTFGHKVEPQSSQYNKQQKYPTVNKIMSSKHSIKASLYEDKMELSKQYSC